MDNIVRCEKGHFYNSSEYRTCPYCQKNTVNPTDSARYAKIAKTISSDTPEKEPQQVDEIGATIGYYDNVGVVEPVTGWLVCIEGSQKGKDFRLCAGRNYIGRSVDMDICLADDPRVSRSKHAIVIFDPVSQTTLCQAGESRELFYLNGKVVTDTVELKQGDILQAGNSKLVFVPFCGTVHTWEQA